MPIRFACEHCGVRLSVSSRKAGRPAKCPKCKAALTIPGPARDATKRPVADAVSHPDDRSDVESEGEDDPFAQFIVYDDDAELVYGSDDQDDGFAATPVDPEKVAVPRSVLYLQGALLGVVALSCFVLGLLVGGGSGGGDGADDQPKPCQISGRVALSEGGLSTSPDEGAVAIVVPQGVHPEKKAEILGLRPNDMEPSPDHEGLATIRAIGGDYTRTDPEGRFQLNVPDTGVYFVLVISAARTQSNSDPPNEVLAQIGRFFVLTPDFFEGHAYHWQAETVRGDRELNVVF